jgi:lysophospholipase
MTLISIPANPVPEGAASGMLTTPDGVSLRFARWAPPAGRKGTVCIFQGRAEFIEKYFETVRDLRARGFAVATFDWRGQGLSQRMLQDPLKGYVRRFSDYQIDLETFVRDVVLPDCPPPVFALGHSMGGLVLIRLAHRGHQWFDRIVLSAPMIGLPGRRVGALARTTLKLSRLFGFGTSYVPKRNPSITAFGSFAGNPLTSDPVRFARNAAVVETEPKLALGAPTVTWTDTAFAAMSDASDPSYPSSIRQPILIVAAGQDQVVSTPAIENFATRLRAGSHLVVPGARHELLMEQDRLRGQFWAAFDAFVPGSPIYK